MADDTPQLNIPTAQPDATDPHEQSNSWLGNIEHFASNLFSSPDKYAPQGPSGLDAYAAGASGAAAQGAADDNANAQGQTGSAYNVAAQGHTPSFLKKVGSAAKATGQAMMKQESQPFYRRFFGYPESLVQEARSGDRVPLGDSRPPRQTEAARMEDPRQVWQQWYNQMREFSYKGK